MVETRPWGPGPAGLRPDETEGTLETLFDLCKDTAGLRLHQNPAVPAPGPRDSVGTETWEHKMCFGGKCRAAPRVSGPTCGVSLSETKALRLLTLTPAVRGASSLLFSRLPRLPGLPRNTGRDTPSIGLA